MENEKSQPPLKQALVGSTWRGLTCPHCGHESGIDPAELKDESPMPYCDNCDGAMLEEPDEDYDDEDNWQPCDNCDLPDACADYGCAIKSGLRADPSW